MTGKEQQYSKMHYQFLIFSFLFFSFLFPALDTDEHIEIPEDTISWLAGIACKYFYIT